MSDLDWNKKVDQVFENVSIEHYFKDKSLVDFILCYIQVDTLLEKKNKQEISPDEIVSKLSSLETKMHSLENAVSYTQQHLNKNQENITIHIQNILNKIQHISDYEIRKSLSELKTQDTRNLQELLDTYYEKMNHVNTKTLNEIDKNIIQNISSNLFNLNQSLTHSIQNHNQINKIHDTLSELHNNFTANSNKKGEYAENILYNKLCAEFTSSEVIETRNIPHSGDFMIKKEHYPTILIESKNFSTNVIKRDIDKFYDDTQQNDCCGIMLNAFGGICNKENYEIEIQGKNILIFIHNYEFNIEHVRMAVNIIYNISQIITEKVSEKVEIMHKTFNALKIEYNGFMQTFRHHLDNIKTSVQSLQQLQLSLLDEFFKRKRVLKTEEKFICNICQRDFTTKRSLDRHYQTIHTQTSNKKSKKGKKGNVEKIEQQEKELNDDEEEEEERDDMFSD